VKPPSPEQGNGEAATADPVEPGPVQPGREADLKASPWLLADSKAPSRQTVKKPAGRNGTTPDPDLKQRVKQLESQLEQATRRADDEAAKAAKSAKDAAELREAEQALIEQRERIEELGKLLEQREAELEEQARQREGTLSRRVEELEATNGKLDLNEATFEDLRDLGLSVTVSARVISYRDTRGGFKSVEELEDIPGLSVELVRVLRDQLKLD
jgi:DNA uptake protein ComE-like DNA-binding protein